MEYTGIPYFPVNANFFEEEVIELLEAKFGIRSSYIVMRLLCKIYKEGYYVSWGKEQCAIFLRKSGGDVDEETMNQIIDLLLKKGFFDKESWEKHHILTSINIQKIWLQATSRRKKDFTQLPYLLIEPAENKRKKDKQKDDPNQETAGNLPAQTELNLDNDDNFRQSKEKQSIAEQNKASSSPKEEGEKDVFDDESFKIPAYAYNKGTHNVTGLIENLERYKVTDLKEQQAILRLSDYGKKATPVWKLFPNTNWKKIEAPGRYIIAALKSN